MPPEVIRFEDVTLDIRRVSVTRAGQPVSLEPKSFDVLRYLIEHRDRLVTKEELLDAVWKDTFVTPNVLTRAVAQLLKALGDDAFEARYIETVPKRGYRFIAPITPVGLGSAGAAAVTTAPAATTADVPARRRPIAAVVVISLLVGGVGLGLYAMRAREVGPTAEPAVPQMQAAWRRSRFCGSCIEMAAGCVN